MPKFWKLSQGNGEKSFTYSEIIETINSSLVYVHKDTRAKGGSSKSQAENFVNADIGDYFYLTHGNQGIYLLGQFIGPASLSDKYRDDRWLERKFKLVMASNNRDSYSGKTKWWTPDDNSTFIPVPEDELDLFENYILKPYFDVTLDAFRFVK